jgi:dimeric dUTPase (all-alpha-NTP-PPase superfamily)
VQTQLSLMFELQDAINTRVNDNWRQQGFEWYRAIWIECAELMDHYGWKWWKHQRPDREQVKLELIDIWHFGLSVMLEKSVKTPSALVALEAAFNDEKVGEFRETLESFTGFALANRDFSVPLYVALLKSADISFDDLYCGYVGKNVLNFFRQDHGYQEGSYHKVWGNREDNDHLVELMAQLDHSDRQFTDKLYGLLQQRYLESLEKNS